MSQNKNKTENIIAPAIGRALSAIAQRRVAPVASKVVRAEPLQTGESASNSTVCTRNSACAM